MNTRSLAALVLLAASAARADSTAGTSSAEFLRFGAGAPTALSEASGAVDRGPTALVWNPAGVAAIDRPEAYLSRMSLPMSVGYDYFGFARPVASGPLQGVIGVSAQLLTQDTMDKANASGNAAGSFSAYSGAVEASWARAFGEYRIGAGVKVIRESIDGEAGTAPALDLGVQRDMGRIKLGASLANLGPELAVAGEHFPLPRTLRLGGAYSLTEGTEAALDVSQSEGRGIRVHVGVKARLWGALSVGAGYMGGGTVSGGPIGLSSGIMLQGKTFRADLTYRPYGDLGEAVQVGIGARFGEAGRTSVKP